MSELVHARVIDLEKGQKLKDYHLGLPPRLRVTEIRGVVVWKDGSPVTEAHLELKDTAERAGGRNLASASGDVRGRFTLKTIEGPEAWVHASVMIRVARGLDVWEATPVRVVTNSNQRPIRLVISKKGPGGVEILR